MLYAELPMEKKIDPQLLQARWILGGVRPESLPDLAVMALEQGFDGPALQQLAGLVRPTMADLESLPQRAFADMGLKPIDKDQAVSFLMESGPPLSKPILSTLVQSFPDFLPRWREHIAYWGGEPAGAYNDMSEFARFVIEDLYDQDRRDEVKRVFQVFDGLLDGSDEETTGLIAVGFFESLQNIASWKPYGYRAFEEFLGARSMQLWREIEAIWEGKSSLADVIRAERARD